MKAARRFSGVNCKNKSSDFVCKSMVVYFGGRKRVCRISTYFLLLNQLYSEPVFFFLFFSSSHISDGVLPRKPSFVFSYEPHIVAEENGERGKWVNTLTRLSSPLLQII